MSKLATATAMAALLLVAANGAANAAPDQLRGKAIVVSWNEQRLERNPETKQERNLTTPFALTVYVSTAGRVFNRLDAGRARSSDQASGSKDQTGFAARAINFAGTRMTTSNTFKSGGARQISATFDSGFSSCSGSVIIGRSGSGPIRQKKLDGGFVDVLSTSVGPVSCAISTNNPF